MRSNFIGPVIAILAFASMILLFAGVGYATHTERMACIQAGFKLSECRP